MKVRTTTTLGTQTLPEFLRTLLGAFFIMFVSFVAILLFANLLAVLPVVPTAVVLALVISLATAATVYDGIEDEG